MYLKVEWCVPGANRRYNTIAYRKVSSIEPIWYMLRLKVRELFRGEDKNEHKKAEK